MSPWIARGVEHHDGADTYAPLNRAPTPGFCGGHESKESGRNQFPARPSALARIAVPPPPFLSVLRGTVPLNPNIIVDMESDNVDECADQIWEHVTTKFFDTEPEGDCEFGLERDAETDIERPLIELGHLD